MPAASFQYPSDVAGKISGSSAKMRHLFAEEVMRQAIDPSTSALFVAEIRAPGLTSKSGPQTIAEILDWLEAWEKAADAAGADLETQSRNFSLAKGLRIPKRISFPNAGSLALFLGADHPRRLRHLEETLDVIERATRRRLHSFEARREIYKLDRHDHLILRSLVAWRQEQTQESLADTSLREIRAERLDTKWLEAKHRHLVLSVFRELDWLFEGGESFEAQLGLFDADRAVVWIRLPGSLDGSTKTGHVPSAFTQAPPGISRVLIAENKTNFERLPVPENTCLIFGAGRGIQRFARDMTWLADMELVLYWGDCDGHGFSILSGLRDTLPATSAILMDWETTVSFHSAIGEEPPAKRFKGFIPNLTPAERQLRDYLDSRGLRLEQERIPRSAAQTVIDTRMNEQSIPQSIAA